MIRCARHRVGDLAADAGEPGDVEAARILRAHEDRPAEADKDARRRDRAALIEALLSDFAHGTAGRSELSAEVRAAAARHLDRDA